MDYIIRPIRPDDRLSWEPIWRQYQSFYKVDLSQEVTETTWSRFFIGKEPIHALVADDADGVIGFVHYIYHRSTWMVGLTCYLQDLFTVEAARRRGVAASLIDGVYSAAAGDGVKRVYWNTHETNASARSLYDRMAARSGFIQYRKDL